MFVVLNKNILFQSDKRLIEQNLFTFFFKILPIKFIELTAY